MTTKDPWPAEGIKHGTRIEEYTWGYLIQKDGTFFFDDSVRPSDAEIMARWSGYLIDYVKSRDEPV